MAIIAEMKNRAPIPEPSGFPRQLVDAHMGEALNHAAIISRLHIRSLMPSGIPEASDLEKADKNARVKTIDIAADDAFRTRLKKAPVEFHGIDAEGGKEAHPDKLGEAMPLSIGIFGQGEQKATYVLDVVEGTTAAAHGRPNAISIAGISTHESITQIPENPKTGEGFKYFRKLFGPEAFKNSISLEQLPHENLAAIMRLAEIPGSHITVATMNRKCNAEIIEAAQKIGAKLELIEAGDLLWGLKAMLSDPEHPIVMMGRGGAEEGSIAQVAAHALDATGQLQAMTEELDIPTKDTTTIWTPQDFIKGPAENSVVLFTPITRNTRLGMSAVRILDEKEGGQSEFLVDTGVIDSKGFRKVTQKVLYSIPPHLQSAR